MQNIYYLDEENEEEKFSIDVTSDRCCFNIFELDELEDVEDRHGNNKIYNIHIKMDSLDSSREKIDTVADIIVTIMEYSSYETELMIYDADAYDADAYEYAEYLSKSSKFKRDESDYGDAPFEYNQIVNGALHRFYINPKYRKQGIGKKLISNLDNIIERTLGIKIRCIVTYVKPDKCQDETNMTEIMTKLIKDAGFEHIADRNYIKDYLEEYYEG